MSLIIVSNALLLWRIVWTKPVARASIRIQKYLVIPIIHGSGSHGSSLLGICSCLGASAASLALQF